MLPGAGLLVGVGQAELARLVTDFTLCLSYMPKSDARDCKGGACVVERKVRGGGGAHRCGVECSGVG